MEREQFTFYASFARAARRIKKPADRCAFYDAVIAFALNGEEPDLDKAPESVALAMELVKPVLVSSRRKAENGRQGGKQSESKPEANGSKPQANESKSKANSKQGEQKQTEAKPKQEEGTSKKESEKEGENKKEDKKENECSLPLTPSPAPAEQTPATENGKREAAEEVPDPASLFTGDLLAAVQEWLSYKREKRQNYQPTGLKSLFTQLRNAAEAYGDGMVAEVIRNCMASGYTGITLDKLPAISARRGKAASCTGFSKEPVDLEKLRKVIGKI